jgi:hypothetical protein
MDITTRAAQCLVEHQILQHVKAALRLTLGWEVQAVGLERKLSSVRFTMHSFCRHLERIMQLEEDGGYLNDVVEQKPNLADKAASLAHEHAGFRGALCELAPAMDRVTADDACRFAELCRRWTELLDRIDAHDQKETELLQAACCDEEGGEG